jgi:predicted glycosyltransferase
MMYTQDSYGLGHLRRATNLANALVRRRSDLSVLLVVDSPVAPFFELAGHIDFIKLPTVVKVEAGVFRAGQLLDSYELVRDMRENLLCEIVRQYAPDAMLVDHMPGGANRELLPTLRMVRESGLPARIVLGLRDIIDAREVTRTVWQREGVYETIQRFYDTVLVYGLPAIFDTAQEYAIAATGVRVRYCGYVCNPDPAKDPQRIRRRLGVGGRALVAALSGGGWDAYELHRTFLEAMRLLRRDRDVAGVVVTGPFMDPQRRRTLRERAAGASVSVHGSVGDSLSRINAADVVVSMAGYNTLTEILRFGKRAIVVPRHGPSAEQRMRAAFFERRGLIRVLDPQDLDAQRLAAAIAAALDAAPPAGTLPDPGLGGVEQACAALLEALPGAPPPPPRAPSVEVVVRQGLAAPRLTD